MNIYLKGNQSQAMKKGRLMDRCSVTGQTIQDFITGRALPDCDDEQIRQFIESLLVEQKGYSPSEIEVDRTFDLGPGERGRLGRAELVVYVAGKPFMTVKSTRGSIVSREREAISASRLACDVVVPYTVVTNGQDAEFLDTRTGQVLGTGLAAIPHKNDAQEKASGLDFQTLDAGRRDRELRVYLAYADFECSSFCRPT